MILLEVDPDLVKPGWTPLVVTVLLGIAVVLLFVSMRRQFRKISIPREDEGDDETTPPASDPSTATTGDPSTARQDPPAG